MDTRKSIKIFITDYDNCLIDTFGSRKDMLCENLISLFAKEKYTAGYACTHRFYQAREINFLKDYMIRIKKYCSSVRKNKKFADFNHDPGNAYTSSVTDNLITALKAHKIELLGVSTPDDAYINPSLALGSRCGIAYTNIIKPYEAAARLRNSDLATKDFIEPEFRTSEATITVEQFKLIRNSKNFQLLEIAHHARAKYPNALIEMHYFDDVIELCQSVQQIQLDSLPANVSISSFLHSSHNDIRADLKKPVASITNIPVPVIIESVSWFKKICNYIFNACITKPAVLEAPKEVSKPSGNGIEIFSRGASSADIHRKLGTPAIVPSDFSEDELENMAVWSDYQNQLDSDYQNQLDFEFSVGRFTVSNVPISQAVEAEEEPVEALRPL